MSRRLERAREIWEGFWFAPESARNLAAARILFATHALWVLLSRDPAGLSTLPAEFWRDVPGSARWRFLFWEGHPGLESVLQWGAVAALLGALAGFRSRWSCLLAGLLLYHLSPLEKLFYEPNPVVKGFTLSVLALVTLGFARCADAWSLDGRGRPVAAAPSWEYGWPLRLVQLFLCQVHLFAGWARILKSGWEAVSGDGLRRYLLLFSQNDQIGAFRSLGPWIADHPTLCGLAAATALAFDLGFWVVLFSKPARRWLVPLAFVGHAGILVSLNIAFLEAPLLLLFVDWDALASRLSGQGNSSGSGGPPSGEPAMGVTARLS